MKATNKIGRNCPDCIYQSGCGMTHPENCKEYVSASHPETWEGLTLVWSEDCPDKYPHCVLPKLNPEKGFHIADEPNADGTTTPVYITAKEIKDGIEAEALYIE